MTAAERPATPTDGPTLTAVTPTVTATEGRKACGDVNDDGFVDSVHAFAVLQFKAGFTDSLPNPESGDVDNDGQLTSQDALLLLQIAAGLIDESDLDCGP